MKFMLHLFGKTQDTHQLSCLFENVARGFKIETFSGSVVQAILDFLNLFLCQVFKRGSFREVLPDQPIGVLV
jgi:hypothetical protein